MRGHNQRLGRVFDLGQVRRAACRCDGRQDADEVELALASQHQPVTGSQNLGQLVGAGPLGGSAATVRSSAAPVRASAARRSRTPAPRVRPIIHSPEVQAATAKSSASPKALNVASNPRIRTGGQASSRASRAPRTAGTIGLGLAWRDDSGTPESECAATMGKPYGFAPPVDITHMGNSVLRRTA